ncbi:dTMP kinase [Desulforhopalus sp. IMCC35007]|uniref:dTMP kinase n=1 Tax=Desulforhopalus sp. IMCC35007 TaxID=2569543 RepID=UPI0010ADED38|nr:dTMP kinase [Desulforhopalus sp. IMCC35007]TKB09144.1 dTMP kinase [Desulforhopalus sp. IMCC35007]
MRNSRGILIVFEGTDGTGKSTQLALLADYLQSRNYPVVTTREPTTGPYGQKIRDLYVKRDTCSPSEELELFLADRKEHVDTLINPSLAEGKIVLCDRYFLSTVAYQGALGFDVEELLSRNSFATPPDIALLFYIPLETALQRITVGRGDMLNDFEKSENLSKVAAIFDSLSENYIKRINAEGSIQQVHLTVLSLVLPLIPDSLKLQA